MYKPVWLESFKRLNPDIREMNAKKERLAVDVMIDQKEAEMKLSPKARQYEGDRKKEWRAWRKEKSREEQLKQLKIEQAKSFAMKFLEQRAKRNARKEKH